MCGFEFVYWEYAQYFLWNDSHSTVAEEGNFGWAITNKCTTYFINVLTSNVPHHTETSQLILIANELTGLYMMGNIGVMG